MKKIATFILLALGIISLSQSTYAVFSAQNFVSFEISMLYTTTKLNLGLGVNYAYGSLNFQSSANAKVFGIVKLLYRYGSNQPLGGFGVGWNDYAKDLSSYIFIEAGGIGITNGKIEPYIDFGLKFRF